MKLFFEKAKVDDKLGLSALIGAFIVGLSGNWIYKTFDLDPTYVLPIIASVPAWNIIRQEPVYTMLEALFYWAVVIFIYTLVLCLPAGVGVLIMNAIR